MEIICNNEALFLSPLRAIFWPREKILFLADLHLGKTGYFRSNGIPIPSTVMMDDLKRLSQLIKIHQPQKIIIAGDMFHHDLNTDIHLFKQWRSAYPSIAFTLVPGNHDKLLLIDYEQLDIQLTSKEHFIAPFLITHKTPEKKEDRFVISGHIHPGYLMAGRARQFLRLPCFIVSPQHIILPAFSIFTGLYTGYENHQDNNYYLIVSDHICRI